MEDEPLERRQESRWAYLEEAHEAKGGVLSTGSVDGSIQAEESGGVSVGAGRRVAEEKRGEVGPARDVGDLEQGRVVA